MKKTLTVLIVWLMISTACAHNTSSMEKISFSTTDSVTIVGSYEAVEKNAGTIALLLHMMPATKESYIPLQEALMKVGIASLAIDLRGHGESTMRGTDTLDYQKFTDADHQGSRLDVDAAVTWLKNRGFEEHQIVMVGASIGANLTIDALSRYPEITKGVLLSPGLNYRSVTTDDVAQKLSEGQRILLVAAEGDTYSADSVRTLAEILDTKGTVIMYDDAMHGTKMWDTHYELLKKIVEFLI